MAKKRRFDFTKKNKRSGKVENVGYLDLEQDEEQSRCSLYFYGDIVSATWESMWYEEDRCPQDIADFLNQLDGYEDIDIYFNSGGGDVFAGLAIYNQLKRYDGHKVGYVDGMAASIASVIMFACDELHFATGAQAMIHKPLCIHHCAIGQFKPIVMNGLYEFSCGSIPDRGVHYGKKYMRKWLDSYDGKKFFVLKMDVHHFFESINRRILKRKLKEVIRDKRFYRLLCILIEHDKIALVAKILTDAGVEIDAEQTKTLVGCIAFDDISGALEILQEIGIAGAMFYELKEIIEEMRKGVPLGYFTSQWFGNFYLKALDHYIKEELHAEHYMRYMDDMVILGKSKKKLHKIHAAIETYLNDNLDLEIKGDWQVFKFEYPVFDKGGNPVLDKDGKQVTKGRMLDFMGFQFHHDRTTIRKSNIEAARRKANHISKQDKISWYNASVMLSYMGLFKHTDTYNYYIDYIKPKINVKKLKRIVSKHSRKENEHDRLEKGDRNTAGQAGGGRQDIVAVNGLPA